ncbi:MAG: hypothetical protein R2932_56655 [Caldilineaceae bacterium]
MRAAAPPPPTIAHPHPPGPAAPTTGPAIGYPLPADSDNARARLCGPTVYALHVVEFQVIGLQ